MAESKHEKAEQSKTNLEVNIEKLKNIDTDKINAVLAGQKSESALKTLLFEASELFSKYLLECKNVAVINNVMQVLTSVRGQACELPFIRTALRIKNLSSVQCCLLIERSFCLLDSAQVQDGDKDRLKAVINERLSNSSQIDLFRHLLSQEKLGDEQVGSIVNGLLLLFPKNELTEQMQSIGIVQILRLISLVEVLANTNKINSNKFLLLIMKALEITGLSTDEECNLISKILIASAPVPLLQGVGVKMQKSISLPNQRIILQKVVDRSDLDSERKRRFINALSLLFKTPSYDQLCTHIKALGLKEKSEDIFLLEFKGFITNYVQNNSSIMLLKQGKVHFAQLINAMTVHESTKKSMAQIVDNEILFEMFLAYFGNPLQDYNGQSLLSCILQKKDFDKFVRVLEHINIMRPGLDKTQKEMVDRYVQQYLNTKFTDQNIPNISLIKRLVVDNLAYLALVLNIPTLTLDQKVAILNTTKMVGSVEQTVLQILLQNERGLKLLHDHNDIIQHYFKTTEVTDISILLNCANAVDNMIEIIIHSEKISEQIKSKFIEEIAQQAEKTRECSKIAVVAEHARAALLQQLSVNAKKIFHFYQTSELVKKLTELGFETWDLLHNKSHIALALLCINRYYIHTPIVQALYMKEMQVKSDQEMNELCVDFPRLLIFARKVGDQALISVFANHASFQRVSNSVQREPTAFGAHTDDRDQNPHSHKALKMGGE